MKNTAECVIEAVNHYREIFVADKRRRGVLYRDAEMLTYTRENAFFYGMAYDGIYNYSAVYFEWELISEIDNQVNVEFTNPRQFSIRFADSDPVGDDLSGVIGLLDDAYEEGIPGEDDEDDA